MENHSLVQEINTPVVVLMSDTKLIIIYRMRRKGDRLARNSPRPIKIEKEMEKLEEGDELAREYLSASPSIKKAGGLGMVDKNPGVLWNLLTRISEESIGEAPESTVLWNQLS